jgi:hypothetical protein
MRTFLQRHEGQILGVLSGFDRLRFRGTLRMLNNVGGMLAVLGRLGVLLKDFRTSVCRRGSPEALAAVVPEMRLSRLADQLCQPVDSRRRGHAARAGRLGPRP